MKGLKLTSPGILLIAAVLAAGGILLADVLFLSPYVETQQQAAMKDVASRTVYCVKVALQNKEDCLLHHCQVFVQSGRLGPLLSATKTAVGGAPEELKELQFAWYRDSRGAIRQLWSDGGESPCIEEVRATLQEIDGNRSGLHASGLVKLPDGVALYVKVPLDSLPPQGGSLLAVRRLDGGLLGNIGKIVGGEIVLNSEASSVATQKIEQTDVGVFWLPNTTLGIVWPAVDAAGRRIGYFQASMPSLHVHTQAQAARRAILIALSLSAGLILLIVAGSHILVTGPIVRLLGRLQKLESGKAKVSDLASDLRGEPLLLARRLESAFEKLALLSRTDQLTGLANRRHFQEVLECFYHQARRYNRPLSLLILDVDHFKGINDTLGHQTGDRVLRAAACEMERACRKADLAARFGGDEFVLLMPETTCREAAIVAERIRAAIRQNVGNAASPDNTVTVSIGVADLKSGETEGSDALVSLADKALYAAKELGRDCVVADPALSAAKWPSHDSRNVEEICQKLTNMDSSFKDLFLSAVEEITRVLEQRDPCMADHARKVRYYAQLLGTEMGLPQRMLQRLQVASALQDIGMVGMPDSILLAQAPLDEAQLQILRKHPLLSVRIMEGMAFLEQEIPAVRYHHERYDGKGYPDGIAGSDIPLPARVLAVADALNALTSPRAYRPAIPLPEAIEEIKKNAGSQFDPIVVDALVRIYVRRPETLAFNASLPDPACTT